MAREGMKLFSPRGVLLVLAFVAVAAVSYAIGAGRAPKVPAAAVAREVPADGDELIEPEEPAEIALPAEAEPPRAPDTATVVLVPALPPKRPPRDILVVGHPPGWVPDPPDAAAPPPAPPATPPPVAEAPQAAALPILRPPNQDLTHSAFDDEDKIDRHPVPDRGSITRSSFDDEDKVDRHPVP